MIKEIVRILIDGERQDDLVPDIIAVAVDEATDVADVARLRLAVTRRLDGSWTFLDDRRFAVWRRLTVIAGYPSATDILFDGYVTHATAGFTVDEDPYLEISGMDATALMNLREIQRAWVDKADHEIAKQIFHDEYGLSVELEDTLVQQTEQRATIFQSETDIQLLRRLANRNGFECRVRGGVGIFRSPNLSGAPQKLLAMGYGPEANLASLTVNVDGTPPTSPRIRRVDPLSKQEDVKTLSDLPEHRLGKETLGELRADLPDGEVLLKGRAPASPAEMESLTRAASRQAGRFVTVSGEIDSRAYRDVLHCGQTVIIKAVGERYSGNYYVSSVSHSFTVDGYTQSFQAYRNALGVTGNEDFSLPTAFQPITPGVAGATTRTTGNRVLPGRQVGTVVSRGL